MPHAVDRRQWISKATGNSLLPCPASAEGALAFFIDPNQFLVFFSDPKHEFTLERFKQVLSDDGVTVECEAEPFLLRWGGGPALRASIIRGEEAAMLAGRLLGNKRKYRKLAAQSDAYIAVRFEDLDAVLDDINTLIVVEAALQQATGGLLYLSWNQSFSGPDE